METDIASILEQDGDIKQINQTEMTQNAHSIDFSIAPPTSDPFGDVVYNILLSNYIYNDPHCKLVCTFCNNPVIREQTLSASHYKTSAQFNVELNRRFNVPGGCGAGPRFGVAYGKKYYKCRDIEGTIYILWAEYVTRTCNGLTNTIHTNCPILINMNSAASFRAIYIFKRTIENKMDLDFLPFTCASPSITWHKTPPFVCEVRPESVVRFSNRYRSLSRNEAFALSMTQSTVQLEAPPFDEVTDSDVEKDVQLIVVNDNNANTEPDPFVEY